MILEVAERARLIARALQREKRTDKTWEQLRGICRHATGDLDAFQLDLLTDDVAARLKAPGGDADAAED